MRYRKEFCTKKDPELIQGLYMGRGGFEPPKQVAADLQSVPFGHSGIYPSIKFRHLYVLTRYDFNILFSQLQALILLILNCRLYDNIMLYRMKTVFTTRKITAYKWQGIWQAVISCVISDMCE